MLVQHFKDQMATFAWYDNHLIRPLSCLANKFMAGLAKFRLNFGLLHFSQPVASLVFLQLKSWLIFGLIVFLLLDLSFVNLYAIRI